MLSRPRSEAQQKGRERLPSMRVAHACDGNAASFVLTGWRGLGSRRDVGEAASHGHVRRPGGGRHLGLPGFCLGALLNVRIRQGFREPLSRMTPGFHENTVRRCEFSSGAISRLRIPAGRSQCGLGQSLSLHGAPEG